MNDDPGRLLMSEELQESFNSNQEELSPNDFLTYDLTVSGYRWRNSSTAGLTNPVFRRAEFDVPVILHSFSYVNHKRSNKTRDILRKYLFKMALIDGLNVIQFFEESPDDISFSLKAGSNFAKENFSNPSTAMNCVRKIKIYNIDHQQKMCMLSLVLG